MTPVIMIVVAYVFTLFAAWQIGRLSMSTKVLKFLKHELTFNQESGDIHVLKLINKLITIL